MKRNILFPLLSIVLLASSCGSSRKAATSAAPYEIIQDPRFQVPVTNLSQPKAKTPELLLSWRLDSLLVAENALLAQTQLGLHVVDLTTGKALYARGERQRMRPASTEKVVTAIAALDVLGPGYMLTTRLLATAPVSRGTLQGDIYLKGAMDPLLTVGDVRSLVQNLKAQGVQRISGRLVADASFKDADEYGWGWCWDDGNPVLSPLLCGGKPGLAMVVQQALRNAGIKVGAIVPGTAPSTARELAAFHRPLTEVLRPMMKESDNLCAEAVFYQLGKSRKQVAAVIADLIARANAASPAGGETASTIADGSGLSLYNYQTPETFTRLLAYAAARPDNIYNPLLEALPIASVDGTLKNRMAGTAAGIAVRAKTGTVTAISSLVGYTTQRSTNHLIAFAIMNQGVPRSAQGRAFQDEVCRLLSE